MHKMLAFSPVPEDGTSQARSFGVFPQIRKKIPFEFLRAEGNFNWSHLGTFDSLFLQRAFMPTQIQLGQQFQEIQKPILVDYDDDLFTVPLDNPTHATYSQPQFQKNVEMACNMAACVTASTDVLAEKLRRFNNNVRVVPNALNLDVLKPLPGDLPRNPIVVWRGSHCHVRDLHAYGDSILEAYEKFPNFHFFFVGYNPWWITEKMNPERVRCVPFDGSYINYMRNMAKIRGAIQIVPLADIPFNHAKSNIAFLEASFAGSVTLAPDWEEWRPTPSVKYTDKASFDSKLFELMSTPLDQLAPQANAAYNWVSRYRNLNLINDLRVDVLKKYCGA